MTYPTDAEIEAAYNWWSLHTPAGYGEAEMYAPSLARYAKHVSGASVDRLSAMVTLADALADALRQLVTDYYGDSQGLYTAGHIALAAYDKVREEGT